MTDSRTATSQTAHRIRLAKSTEARIVRSLAALGVLVLLLFPGGGVAGNGKGGGGGPSRTAPKSTVPPTISGSAAVGQTLTAGTGSWSGPVSSYTYEWLHCDTSGNSCSSVAGAKSASYSPVAWDVGYTLRVSVTASNRYGSSVATSSPTSAVAAAPVVAPPANTTLPAISGNTVVGQRLSATAGGWNPTPTSYAYAWRRCDSAGASCASISGATSSAYVLTSSDQGSTLRVVVTATDSGGSTGATSSQTGTVTTSSSTSTVTYPASYYTGPLGQQNILPPKAGAFLGIWGTSATQTSLESYVGRKLDIVGAFYNSAAGACYNTAPFSDGKPQTIYADGQIPIVTWSPGYTLDQINAGSADACIRDVANRAKAFGHLFMLRPYHEFNGTWMIYSGCGQSFIDAWRRTVSIFQQQGATNVAWVYPPAEGYRTCAEQSYPGDSWVDWVATSSYNHNTSNGWCGYHTGWCEFSDMFHYDPSVSLHDYFGPHKPIMFTETGSVEDPSTPGRKGNWFRNLGSTMKNALPYGRAVVYFDQSTTNYDWRIDTSQSSLDGFRDLAQDPYFNTRS